MKKIITFLLASLFLAVVSGPALAAPVVAAKTPSATIVKHKKTRRHKAKTAKKTKKTKVGATPTAK